MDYFKIGSFLQELRKSKGLTQSDIAEHFGINSKTVSKWECGNSLPEIPIIKGLAEYYEVTVDEILNGCRKEEKDEVKEDRFDYFEYKRRKLDLWMMLSFITLLLGFLLLFVIGYANGNPSTACFTSIGIYFVSFSLFIVGIYLLGDVNKNLTSKQMTKIKDRRYINYSLYLVLLLYFSSLSIVFYAIRNTIGGIIDISPSIEEFLIFILLGFLISVIIFAFIINMRNFSSKVNRVVNIILEIVFVGLSIYNLLGLAITRFVSGYIRIGDSNFDFEFRLFDFGILGYILLFVVAISLILEVIFLISKNKYIILSKVANLIGFIGILLVFVYMESNKNDYVLKQYELVINTTNYSIYFNGGSRSVLVNLIIITTCYIPLHIIYDLITIIRNKKTA